MISRSPVTPAVIFTLASCTSQRTTGPAGPRYAISAEPVDVGGVRICVAVEPRNTSGIWWWDAGRDCATRSSSLMKAEDAAVSQTGRSGQLNARFKLQLISDDPTGRFVDVSIVLEGDHMAVPATGARCRLTRRDGLDVPEGVR
jgi:hypothetical protein